VWKQASTTGIIWFVRRNGTEMVSCATSVDDDY
jgi:hypothetical protein